MVEFLFSDNSYPFYVRDDGTLESAYTENGTSHGSGDHFFIYNIDIHQKHNNVIHMNLGKHNDFYYLDIANASNINFTADSMVNSSFTIAGKPGISHFTNFVESVDFNDPKVNLGVDLHHYKDGVDEIVQTVKIDYNDKNAKYNILHKSAGGFEIKKK